MWVWSSSCAQGGEGPELGQEALKGWREGKAGPTGKETPAWHCQGPWGRASGPQLPRTGSTAAGVGAAAELWQPGVLLGGQSQQGRGQLGPEGASLRGDGEAGGLVSKGEARMGFCVQLVFPGPTGRGAEGGAKGRKERDRETPQRCPPRPLTRQQGAFIPGPAAGGCVLGTGAWPGALRPGSGRLRPCVSGRGRAGDTRAGPCRRASRPHAPASREGGLRGLQHCVLSPLLPPG